MSKDVINFVEKRKQSIEKKRRNFERVMFQNFLGCYSVIDNNGSIYPIDIIDISETGCLFQVPWNENNDRKFEKDKNIGIRLYFTKNSYIPAFVLVKYGSEFVDEHGRSFMRYGCEFDRDNQTFEALDAFISFIYKFAEHSSVDKGDQKVFFL